MNKSGGKNKFTKSNVENTASIIYDYIVEYVDQNGYPPSVRDICKGTGIKSTSTVHSHLKRLQESGKLDYTAGRRRAISINSDDDNNECINFDDSIITMLPLVGTVTAGAPILAHENIERTLPFPSEYFGGKGDVFALEVRGDSMIDAAILDGDYVIVRKQSAADFGDIIVALIEDEATVKTFIRKDGKTFLQPENSAYSPIPFYSENCKILGKVIGVFRSSI